MAEEKTKAAAGKAKKGAYYKGYYSARRAEILEARRRRYADDPAYAEAQRTAAREYREKMKKERKPREGPVKRTRKPVMVAVDGRQVPAFTVGTVAAKIGRSIPTLNHWTSLGLLPETPYKSARGDRLYTEAMILELRTEIQRRGVVAKDDFGFKAAVEERWRALGVPVPSGDAAEEAEHGEANVGAGSVAGAAQG